jgi:hypothetical protein
MSMLVFWVVTPCGLLEDGDSIFLKNSGIYLQVHMVLLHRKPTLRRYTTSIKAEALKNHFTQLLKRKI